MYQIRNLNSTIIFGRSFAVLVAGGCDADSVADMFFAVLESEQSAAIADTAFAGNHRWHCPEPTQAIDGNGINGKASA